MKIRMSFVLVISLVVLINASLPVSFAADVPNITTSLTRPETYQRVVDGVYHTQFSICVYSQDGIYISPEGIKYSLQTFEILSDSRINVWFKGTRICCSAPIISSRQNCFDLENGNLVTSYSNTYFESTGIGGNDYKYIVSAQPLPQVQNRQVDQYILDVPEWMLDTSTRSNEFVTWSVNPPVQNQYHSPLSEPVADQFNSYMVIDDRFLWISYRVNGIYTRNSNIESASEIYSQSVQISESGTGSYSGSSNGYTEDVSLPDGEYNGASVSGSGGTTLYAGGYSGYDFGNIDFSSVNQGSVHFNSSGTVTFNDKEYYPVSFSQSDILSYYRLYCIPTDTDNFAFWLAPDRSVAQNIVVNMDFFYSEFDLDGNYIRSSFHSVTNTDVGLFDSYQSEDDISSIRCYGIDFYNLNNLPFNLSSVIWQYDIDFARWRDDVKDLLQSIYNTLSSDPSAPAPETYPDYAGEIPSVEIISGASPEDAGNLFSRSQNIVPQESIFAINQWRDFFNIPDLIGACMFALTVGTIIIILGKRKSE